MYLNQIIMIHKIMIRREYEVLMEIETIFVDVENPIYLIQHYTLMSKTNTKELFQ